MWSRCPRYREEETGSIICDSARLSSLWPPASGQWTAHCAQVCILRSLLFHPCCVQLQHYEELPGGTSFPAEHSEADGPPSVASGQESLATFADDYIWTLTDHFAVVLDLNRCDRHDAVTELPAVRVAMMRMPAEGAKQAVGELAAGSRPAAGLP